MSKSDTEQLLSTTLREMMTTQSMNHISVAALTEKACVNRNTFYYHFDDIYALLEWTFNQEIIEQVHTNLSVANWQDKYMQALMYIKDNRGFCMSALHSVGRRILESFLYSVGASVVRPVVEDIDNTITTKTKDDIVDFYAGALTAQLIRWLDGGLVEPESDLMARADLMLTGTIEFITRQR